MGGEAREIEGESEGGMEGGIPQTNQLVLTWLLGFCNQQFKTHVNHIVGRREKGRERKQGKR